MKELAKKVLYCLQMMRLLRHLTRIVVDDYKKRIIGRMILVYLDAFLKRTPTLKNQVGKLGNNVKLIDKSLKQLTHDYESYWAKIRDNLAAHRHDLDFLERLELWNDNDGTIADLFIDEATSIYELLSNLESTLPRFSESSELKKIQSDCNIKLHPKNLPMIASDNLAITRENTVCSIPLNDLQERGSQVISILHTLKFLYTLYSDVAVGKDTQRLIKPMIILDSINLIDNLYSKKNQNKNKGFSFSTICKQYNIQGYVILKNAHKQLNSTEEKKLREVRKKIAAHVDSLRDLDDLLYSLDQVNINDLKEIFISAYKAFNSCCRSDIRTRIFFPEPSHVAGVKSISTMENAIKPY
jgi:hypothetical protein